jgi:peptidoglycan hydrolase-like protein with peptidoglycan-binding domain
VPPPRRVRALQCLLTEKGSYRGPVDGRWSSATVAAFQAWQAGHGTATSPVWSRTNWMSLLAAGERPVLKIGSTGPAVRRLQRTLNAAGPATPVRIDGLFGSGTSNALRAWQRKVRVEVSGVAGRQTWRALSAGRA